MCVHIFSLPSSLPLSLLPPFLPPQGGFAHCYELIDMDTNHVFAGKIVPKSLLVKPHQKDKVYFIPSPFPLSFTFTSSSTPVYNLPFAFSSFLSPTPSCFCLSSLLLILLSYPCLLVHVYLPGVCVGMVSSSNILGWAKNWDHKRHARLAIVCSTWSGCMSLT